MATEDTNKLLLHIVNMMEIVFNQDQEERIILITKRCLHSLFTIEPPIHHPLIDMKDDLLPGDRWEMIISLLRALSRAEDKRDQKASFILHLIYTFI